MNKKLIAMAVAAAFAAPAAMAEVTLYGKAHVDVRFGENDDTVNSNSSRLGVKGAEDLGNGLKAVFKYEMTYDITDGGGISGTPRDSYVGLSSNEYGSLLVGRMASPNKAALYAAGNVHLADSIADFASDYASKGNWNDTTAYGRANNAIAYFSPSLGGVKLIAAMIPEEDEDNNNADSAGDDNGLADYYGLAITYGGNGLKAAAGMSSNSDANIDIYNLGASYTFNNVTIGAQYEDEENNARERDAFGVSAKASFGNNAIIGSYTAADTNNVDTDDIRLALQHSMSKRTSVYVAYHNEDVDGGSDTDQFALGMIHSF